VGRGGLLNRVRLDRDPRGDLGRAGPLQASRWRVWGWAYVRRWCVYLLELLSFEAPIVGVK
jgi:hypothetical protein